MMAGLIPSTPGLLPGRKGLKPSRGCGVTAYAACGDGLRAAIIARGLTIPEVELTFSGSESGYPCTDITAGVPYLFTNPFDDGLSVFWEYDLGGGDYVYFQVGCFGGGVNDYVLWGFDGNGSDCADSATVTDLPLTLDQVFTDGTCNETTGEIVDFSFLGG